MTNRLKQAWLALCVVALAGCDPTCDVAMKTAERAERAVKACEAARNCAMTASEYEAYLDRKADAQACIAKGRRRNGE